MKSAVRMKSSKISVLNETVLVNMNWKNNSEANANFAKHISNNSSNFKQQKNFTHKLVYPYTPCTVLDSTYTFTQRQTYSSIKSHFKHNSLLKLYNWDIKYNIDRVTEAQPRNRSSTLQHWIQKSIYTGSRGTGRLHFNA